MKGVDIMNNTEKVCPQKIELPKGEFHSGNCNGCIHYYPQDRDSNGRGYCSHYDTYYYPRERGGCLSRED